jgi:hypothetical protein
MSIVEKYPDRIPPEVVVENSDLTNKESIIDKIVPAPAVDNILEDKTKKTIKADGP